MPHLRYAVADAHAVADALISLFGFQPRRIARLTDETATRSRIEAVLESQLGNPAKVGKDDRVVIFLAGHGVNRSNEDGGYFAPVDASRSHWENFIAFDHLTEMVEALPAKHVMLIIDACYSGPNLMRGISDRVAEDFIARPTRQILTAGRADEMVMDGGGPGGQHSIFTSYLLEGLGGKAADERGLLVGSSLITYVTQGVSHDQRARQTPVGGWLSGDGDFVFRSASPQHLPLEFTKRLADSRPVHDRLEAVADLAFLAVNGEPQVAEDAKYALKLVVQTDMDEQVKAMATHVLNEVRQIVRNNARSQPPRPDAGSQGGTNPSKGTTISPGDSGPSGERPAGESGAFSQSAWLVEDARPESPGQPDPPSRPHRNGRFRAGLALMAFLTLLVAFIAFQVGLLSQPATLSLNVGPTVALDGQADVELTQTRSAEDEVLAAAQILEAKQAQATQVAAGSLIELTPVPSGAAGGLAYANLNGGLVAPPASTQVTTPTPWPTVDARSGPASRVLIEDHFDTNQGWLLGSAMDGVRDIRDGTLYLELNDDFNLGYIQPASALVPVVADFFLEVDATVLTPDADGMVLVLFRTQPDSSGEPDNYYAFGVALSGEAILLVKTYGQPYPLAPLQAMPTGPLSPDRPIHLRVVARGDVLSLAVNGLEILTAQDQTFARGGFGLGARALTTVPYTVTFDNLVLGLPD